MNRRDFFKGILAVASTAPLVMVGSGPWQVLKPPHGKRKGILTVPGFLSPQDVETLRKQWQEAVSSPADKAIVLSGGMKYEEVFIGEETELQSQLEHTKWELANPRG